MLSLSSRQPSTDWTMRLQSFEHVASDEDVIRNSLLDLCLPLDQTPSGELDSLIVLDVDDLVARHSARKDVRASDKYQVPVLGRKVAGRRLIYKPHCGEVLT